MNDHLSTDRLVDYLHGELPPADDALVHAHLAGCAACRDARDAEAMLLEALRATAKAEEREMPSLVKAAVWERVRAARPGPLARVAALLRPAFALPVAAALAVAVFFASPLAPHHGGPTIDATYYLEAHAAQTAQTPLSERTSSLVLETSMNASAASSPFVDAATDGYAKAASAADDVR
jgi:predicted anti-sigma-YlaC factor YlaD